MLLNNSAMQSVVTVPSLFLCNVLWLNLKIRAAQKFSYPKRRKMCPFSKVSWSFFSVTQNINLAVSLMLVLCPSCFQ